MRPSIWPYARAAMAPQDRSEVEAWCRQHPRASVVIGRVGRSWSTTISGLVPGTVQQGHHADSPIGSFRDAVSKADVPVVSLLSERGAA